MPESAMALDGAVKKPRIRLMSMADYEATTKLWEKCEGLGMGEGDSRVGIRRFLRRNPGLSFVAVHGGEIIGAALCGHDGRRGFIYHLAVSRSHRHQGVARNLVEACLRRLRSRGIGKYHIVVFARNRAGQAFWKRVGWTLREDLRIMAKFAPEV